MIDMVFKKKHRKILSSMWSEEFQKEVRELLDKRIKELAKYEGDPIKYARVHNKYVKIVNELRDRATEDGELRQAVLSALRHKN